jgi:hypothetical protein
VLAGGQLAGGGSRPSAPQNRKIRARPDPPPGGPLAPDVAVSPQHPAVRPQHRQDPCQPTPPASRLCTRATPLCKLATETVASLHKAGKQTVARLHKQPQQTVASLHKTCCKFAQTAPANRCVFAQGGAETVASLHKRGAETVACLHKAVARAHKPQGTPPEAAGGPGRAGDFPFARFE